MSAKQKDGRAGLRLGTLGVMRVALAAGQEARIGADALANVASTATSFIRNLDMTERRARIHGPPANTDLLFPRMWVPQFIGSIPVGQTILICYCAAGAPPAPQPDRIPDNTELTALFPKMDPIGARTGAPEI